MPASGQVKYPNRKDRILNFIKAYIKQHRYSPTYREIGDACDISSLSLISHYIEDLAFDGKISRAYGIPRSIVVLDGEED